MATGKNTWNQNNQTNNHIFLFESLSPQNAYIIVAEKPGSNWNLDLDATQNGQNKTTREKTIWGCKNIKEDEKKKKLAEPRLLNKVALEECWNLKAQWCQWTLVLIFLEQRSFYAATHGL